MLVSPAEPKPLRELGKVSSLCEKLGCDFLVPVKGGFAGVQRKEVKDFRASVEDGRLGKEIAQARGMNVTPMLLVLEGKIRFGVDGMLLDRWGEGWSRSRWYGALWHVQLEGWWQVQTDNMGETKNALRTFENWVRKGKHGTFASRGAAPSLWGANQTNRDWCEWVCQGLPGVGPETAVKIVEKFRGIPFAWKAGVTVDELCTIKGIGPKTAQKLYAVLNGEGESA